MGIYDREYYRKDGPGFLESFTGQGRACTWLIVLNVLFFLAQLMTPPGRPTKVPIAVDNQGRPVVGFDDNDRPIFLGADQREPQFGDRYGIVQEALQLEPEAVKHGQVWRLLTYAFLHSTGIWHILFNMLFLWWFGHEMEELYGSREFLAFYLVSAFLGGVAYFLWAWAQGDNLPCVGASGAVTAVMVLCAFHYPTRVIRIWYVLPVPIWLFVGFQVLQDCYIFASGQQTTTAVVVHLAGAAFGLGYYKLNWRLAPFWTALTRFRLPRRRPRLTIYRDDPPTPPRTAPSRPVVAAPAAAEADEHLEAKVDAVLEKVGRVGIDQLTESERALLARASEVYKRKQRS
jgi:membrane associated rhomboid family serine protease